MKLIFKHTLSSSRRRMTDLGAFNQIFKFRNIVTPISGFLPVIGETHLVSRKEEIESFVLDLPDESYIILDDDKTLNGLNATIKKRWVATAPLIGLDQNALKKMMDLLKI